MQAQGEPSRDMLCIWSGCPLGLPAADTIWGAHFGHLSGLCACTHMGRDREGRLWWGWGGRPPWCRLGRGQQGCDRAAPFAGFGGPLQPGAAWVICFCPLAPHPFRLRQGAEALAAALEVPLPLALVAAAQYPAALTQPPLRTRQAVEGVAAALGLPFAVAAAMVVREAALLGVHTHALGSR